MSTLGNPAIRAVYPRDFPGVDSLIVGLHQVIWYRVNNAEFVQMGGGGEREIARDSFVIPQPAQEDAGTDPDIDDSMD